MIDSPEFRFLVRDRASQFCRSSCTPQIRGDSLRERVLLTEVATGSQAGSSVPLLTVVRAETRSVHSRLSAAKMGHERVMLTVNHALFCSRWALIARPDGVPGGCTAQDDRISYKECTAIHGPGLRRRLTRVAVPRVLRACYATTVGRCNCGARQCDC